MLLKNRWKCDFYLGKSENKSELAAPKIRCLVSITCGDTLSRNILALLSGSTVFLRVYSVIEISFLSVLICRKENEIHCPAAWRCAHSARRWVTWHAEVKQTKKFITTERFGLIRQIRSAWNTIFWNRLYGFAFFLGVLQRKKKIRQNEPVRGERWPCVQSWTLGCTRENNKHDESDSLRQALN